jgi:hypothetical protein
MSDEERKPIDLSWLPKMNADEWRIALSDFLGLRLMLAGIGLRHARDANGDLVNQPLAIDIGVVQQRLQQLIDRAEANAKSVAELAEACGQPTSERPVMADVQLADNLKAALAKWDNALAELTDLLRKQQDVVTRTARRSEQVGEQVALELTASSEALADACIRVAVIVRDVRFIVGACGPAAATEASVH